MITLTLGNSMSRLTGLTPSQLASVRDYVSIKDVTYNKYNKLRPAEFAWVRDTKNGPMIRDAKGRLCPIFDRRRRRYTDRQKLRADLSAAGGYAYFPGHMMSKRPLVSKRGELMSGLVFMVHDWAKAQGVTLQIVDPRVKPKPTPGMFRLTLPAEVTPYAEQTEAVEVAFKAGHGTVEACTGFGKSVLMMLLVQRFQMRTLIVVPNLNLKNQLRQAFHAYFGDTPNTTIENIDSPALKKASDYDLLLIDEAHHVAAATYRKLNAKVWGGIYHRLFFSGTPYRNIEAEQALMVGIAGQKIYSVPYAKARDKGYVVPVESFYYPVQPKKTNAVAWAGVYKDLVVENDARNELIASLLKSLHSHGKSALCLVKEVKQGEKLAALTGAGFAHGNAEDCAQLIRWFSEGRLKVLIATEGVAGEGSDTKAAEYVIIAGLGKSKPAFLQKVGRGVRRYPGKDTCKVILFSDRSHKWTEEHFKLQAGYLESEFGAPPIELDLPEES